METVDACIEVKDKKVRMEMRTFLCVDNWIDTLQPDPWHRSIEMSYFVEGSPRHGVGIILR